MKRLILSLAAALALSGASAETAWVTLNNGNIIKGDVTRTDTRVTIVTPDGRTLSYSPVEVYKISATEPVLPAVGKDPALADYSESDRGFWIRGRVGASYALFLTEHCTPFAEIDVAGGYRFNQYLKAGVGLGGRMYFQNDRIRARHDKWSLPIFATVEGNFVNDTYRTVVPYYSFDLGAAVRDGFMMRPGVGIRVGSKRSALVVGLNYTGQVLKYRTGKDRFVSALGISVGYEY